MWRSYQQIDRRKSRSINVGNVKVGGKAPISVQTMTNTLTSDVNATVAKIKRVVKVLGMVNCTPDFIQHPFVINGFSELMADVFGKEQGIGVRSAVGMMLPNGIPVEVEAMFELY